MSALAKLKLVAAQPERKSPAILRRVKLAGKLDEQIESAKAQAGGSSYAATRIRVVQDKDTGERRQVEVATRVKPWWWKAANGKLMLAIRYGAKPLEIAKGKNAIEFGTMAELLAGLEAVKQAVQAGELDPQIELASGSLRAGFATKKS